MAAESLRGSFRFLFLYDVAEGLHLDAIRSRLGAPGPVREPEFRQPVPEYVRFEAPPVREVIEELVLPSGERLAGRINYYDYGVVSLKLELRFEGDWPTLVKLAGRWIAAPDLEQQASSVVRRRLELVQDALLKPYPAWSSEDYYIVHVEAAGSSATELIVQHGAEIAQIVRGEAVPLSTEERQEILASRMSYYPNDLLVAGWMTAFIYDTPEGAAPTVQLLEYANAQLLEFRHYDQVLTRVLADVYKSLDEGTGVLGRWRLQRRAKWLNTIRLDVIELTERMDNSLKFLSDMFAARVYRLVSAKVGVPDYRKLVDQKLETAGELYRFMMDEFHQGRAFVLELMIVIILIIDLYYLFRGKS